MAAADVEDADRGLGRGGEEDGAVDGAERLAEEAELRRVEQRRHRRRLRGQRPARLLALAVSVMTRMSCAASTMYCCAVGAAGEQVGRIDVALARRRRATVAGVAADGGEIAGERIGRGRRGHAVAGGDAGRARAVEVDVEADAGPALLRERIGERQDVAAPRSEPVLHDRHRHRSGDVRQREPEADGHRRGGGRRHDGEVAVGRAREADEARGADRRRAR